MGQGALGRPKLDLQSIWYQELHMRESERRKRYKCGTEYVAVSSLAGLSWETHVEKAIQTGLKIKKEEARQDAVKHVREQMKRRRVSSTRLESISQRSVESAETSSAPLGRQGRGWIEEDSDIREEHPQNGKPRNNSVQKSSAWGDEPSSFYVGRNPLNEKIVLFKGDITTLEVDAVVSVCSHNWINGGTVHQRILKAAGNRLDLECRTLGTAKLGDAKITLGYNLPATYVLHSVGPTAEDPIVLATCYRNVLTLVDQYEVKAVAFCNLAGLSGNYSLDPFAANLAIATVREWLETDNNHRKIELIVFCVLSDRELEIYEKLMPLYFPPKDVQTKDIVAQYKAAYESYDYTTDPEFPPLLSAEKQSKSADCIIA